MATGRVPTTANSPLTAKGDLFGYSTTQARVAVGNDGETLVADSSTTTGLRYQGLQAAGKNLLINGGFDIWQRGTSFASGGYTADRWTDSGVLSNMTASQQTSGAPNGSRYILRYTATGASAYRDIYQYIETATAQQAWGNTVTFSIKMRRNSTATGGNLNWAISKSSTVDAGSGATWTIIANANTTVASLTTGTTAADWTTITITAAIPNDGTANSLRVNVGFSAAQANGSIIEFAQAQLEIGSVATAFTRTGGTIAGELAACQRYYYRTNWDALTGYAVFGHGAAQTTTNVRTIVPFPVNMRVRPTAIDFPTIGTFFRVLDFADNVLTAPTGVAFDSNQTSTISGYLNWTTSGATANRPYLATGNNSTGAYLGWSAEL